MELTRDMVNKEFPVAVAFAFFSGGRMLGHSPAVKMPVSGSSRKISNK
jgi:hypothetical protein